MTSASANLVLRIVSALVLLPIVLFAIARGGIAFGVLLGVAAAICAMEYQQMAIKRVTPAGVFALLAAGLVPFVASGYPDAAATVSVVAAGSVLFLGWTWYLFSGDNAGGPTASAHLLTSFVYGAFGLACVAAMRGTTDGAWWVVAALTVTWGNDTAAYVGGRLFGRHKLFPTVSPNKTWEGFLSGFAGAFCLLLVLRAVFAKFLTLGDCGMLAAVGGILGPLGDLCESMLKRSFGVKDSGRSIPGHGGMLDRIDSLLFIAPWVLFYIRNVRTLLPL